MKEGMEVNDIYRFLRKKQGEMISYLEEMVNLESPSLDKTLVDRLADWNAANFKQLTGGNTRFFDNDTYGKHIRVEWGEGEEQLLVIGHIDTVWPSGTINKMPFKIEEGKAHGPGVFDMKGGIIQGLFALHALQELGYILDKKVVFLMNSDEEVGSPSSQKIIEEEAEKSEFTFVLEPAMERDGKLKTFRKGVGIFEVDITGIPAHSGIAPLKGASALEELSHQIIYLHSLTDHEKGTTINVGKARGGTAFNVVAEKAMAELDMRVMDTEESDRVAALIKNLEPRLKGTEITVHERMRRYPLERTPEVVSMFHTAQHLAKEQLKFNLSEQSAGGFSDGNLTARYNPTLDGLGAVGDGAHARHEHLIVDEMPRRSALLALLLLEYGMSN